MKLYYYKVAFKATDNSKFFKEFRILTEHQDSAAFIFEKIIKDHYAGSNYTIVTKNTGSIHDMSPALIDASNNQEGYFNPTDYNITIELLLPYTVVNCRHEIIDDVLLDIKNIGA